MGHIPAEETCLEDGIARACDWVSSEAGASMLSWLLKRLTDKGSKLPGALVVSDPSNPSEICSNCRAVALLDIMAPNA